MLVSGWFNGGSKMLAVSFFFLVIVSKFYGPYLVYKLLNRVPVWIPRVGDVGSKSEDWEWRYYSLLVGLGPIALFSFSAIGFTVD
jgi:hypothetical protein